MAETYWETNTRRQNPCKICAKDYGYSIEIDWDSSRRPERQAQNKVRKEGMKTRGARWMEEGREGRGCRHCLCDEFADKTKHGVDSFYDEKTKTIINKGKSQIEELFQEAGLEMPSKVCPSCMDNISRENLILHGDAIRCHCRTKEEVEELRKEYIIKNGEDPAL